MKRPAVIAAFLVLAGALVFGAATGFPVFDDGYLVLLVREHGVASLAPEHPDRPIYGILIQAVTAVLGLHRYALIAFSLGFWALLAWQVARLWSRLFPERRDLEPIAALMVLSPVVVETQYTTLTTVLPVNLPVSLGLAAILLGLRGDGRPGVLVLLGAALLAGAAVLVSEYGVATAAAGICLLAVLGRFRAAAGILAGAAVGYGLFRRIADLAGRDLVSPAVQFGIFRHEPAHALVRWLAGVWFSLAGAWGAAAGEAFQMTGHSKSTILAALAGLLAGGLVYAGLRRPVGDETTPGYGRRLAALVAAVGGGLLPVAFAHRSAVMTVYESRYRLPVLPFAIVATLLLVERASATRYRAASLALIVCLGADRATDLAFAARNRQVFLEEIGERLLPLVRASTGMTAAVLPGQGTMDAPTELTPKATLRWPDELERRAWVMSPAEALIIFGPRTACRDASRLDTYFVLRQSSRHGPLDHLFWVPLDGHGVAGDFEPYCVGAPH